MTEIEEKNLANMRGWYNEMWGKCASEKIPQFTNETYLRHDPGGPALLLTGQQYSDLVGQFAKDLETVDFKYRLFADGDFVGAIGLMAFNDGMEWDWVQLFRLKNGKLSETWLPAMGVKAPLAYPRPENSWADDAVPDQDHNNLPPNKQLIKDWFEAFAAGGDVTAYLAPNSRWHNIHDCDITLTPDDVQSRLNALTQGDTARDMRLHLIGQDDFVIATGLWNLGEDGRRWNWVIGFQIEGSKIARVWWNAIGGTDTSIEYGAGSGWHMDMMPDGCTRVGSKITGS